MIFIKISYREDDDLSERQERHYVTVAKRDLKRRFRANIKDSVLALAYQNDFEVTEWPSFHADLLALSKLHPRAEFHITEVISTSVIDGEMWASTITPH